MCVRLLEILNGLLVPVGCLIKFGGVVVRVLEVYAIVLFGYLNSLVNLTIKVTNATVQIVSSGLFVQCLGFLNHLQLYGYHTELRLYFRLFLGLPYAPGSSSKLHIPDTDLGDIKASALDTHDCHLLPDC